VNGSTLRSPKKGGIATLYTTPPADRLVVCLDHMGPASAKSHPGRPIVRITTGRPDQPAARARQEIDDGRRGEGYIFGAICPKKGKGAGLVLPYCDTGAMNRHLAEISATVDPGAHAVLILDQAGWHATPKLNVPATPAPCLPAAADAPKQGGNLRVAMLGGNSSDTLDAHTTVTQPDTARVTMLYDCLATVNNDGQVSNALAESIEPNASATEWTIRLKKGVTFHNGQTMTADDVKASFAHVLDKSIQAPSTAVFANVQEADVLDPMTVRLVLSKTDARIFDVLANNFPTSRNQRGNGLTRSMRMLPISRS